MTATKKKTSRKAKKDAGKSVEQLRKEAIKVAEANIAAIEHEERAAAKAAKYGGENATSGDTPKKAATGRRPKKDAAGAKTGGDTAKVKKTPKAKTKPKREAKPKRISGLDAAAQVLAESKEPMSCRAIVDAMLETKLWSTSGATPHATIYAAIIREIATKGKESRFRKVDRGRFTSNAATGPGKKGA